MGSNQVPPRVGEPVRLIVSTIREVETDLDPVVLEAAVLAAGGRRARLRELAAALAVRPGVLTDGRSPAPACVGDLLIALRKAGATRISPPVCATPGCGRELSSMQRRGQDWHCPGCRLEWAREECAGCGQAKTVNTRGPGGQEYCWPCSRKDPGDPVADIVTVVTSIDPRASGNVIAAAAMRAAPGMMACRKLAQALRDRPGLLTGNGAATPVLPVLRLI